jgi:hypothetical protein
MIKITITALALATVFTASAQAQTTRHKREESGAVGGANSGGAAAAITPEDRVYIRERVVTREVPSVRYEGEVVVGSELPSTVRYYEIDGRPSLSTYRYTRVNDRYVVVDSRGRVVEVIN